MALVYGDEIRSGSFSGTPISQWSEGAVMGSWQRHVENRAFLQFMYRKSTALEKLQASKELGICDRKIAFWERHPQFNLARGGEFTKRIAAQWAGK